jgi:hypothetical protein
MIVHNDDLVSHRTMRIHLALGWDGDTEKYAFL